MAARLRQSIELEVRVERSVFYNCLVAVGRLVPTFFSRRSENKNVFFGQNAPYRGRPLETNIFAEGQFAGRFLFGNVTTKKTQIA